MNEYTGTLALTISSIFLIISLTHSIDAQEPVQLKYYIENLKGDKVVTFKHWNKMVDEPLYVNIINSANLPEQKIQIIKETILSSVVYEIDDSLNHKGPKGTSSNYYVGWQGALSSIQQETKYSIPKNFEIINSGYGSGDIVITLSSLQDSDGYAGYAKSMTDGNQILKSNITIFDADNLSDTQLSTILRHEFGHAIGLAHSSAPEDLMYPSIETDFPYISDCNISAIIHLYENNVDDKVICEK